MSILVHIQLYAFQVSMPQAYSQTPVGNLIFITPVLLSIGVFKMLFFPPDNITKAYVKMASSLTNTMVS